VDATAEEVALWQTAQEELATEIGRPKGTWSQAMDLAKWGTAFIATITFLVLLMDWMYAGNFYSELGVLQLAQVRFGFDPIHARGVFYFSFSLLWIGLQVVLVYIGYYASIYPRLQKPALHRTGALIALCVIPVFLGIVAVLETDEQAAKVLYGWAPVAPVALILWLFIKDSVQSVTKRRGSQALIALLSAFGIFFGIFWSFPAEEGRETAREIFRGKVFFPPVLVVTQEVYLASNKVEIYKGPDGLWAYGPQMIEVPNTDRSVPSLQYLGSDEDAFYFLDIGAASIHAIPKDAVLEIVFISWSEEAWTAPDVEMFSNWTTPTPAPTSPPTEPHESR